MASPFDTIHSGHKSVLFERMDTRADVPVAVFTRIYDYSDDPQFVLDRSSLEARIQSIERQGLDASEERQALTHFRP